MPQAQTLRSISSHTTLAGGTQSGQGANIQPAQTGFLRETTAKIAHGIVVTIASILAGILLVIGRTLNWIGTTTTGLFILLGSLLWKVILTLTLIVMAVQFVILMARPDTIAKVAAVQAADSFITGNEAISTLLVKHATLSSASSEASSQIADISRDVSKIAEPAGETQGVISTIFGGLLSALGWVIALMVKALITTLVALAASATMAFEMLLTLTTTQPGWTMIFTGSLIASMIVSIITPTGYFTLAGTRLADWLTDRWIVQYMLHAWSQRRHDLFGLYGNPFIGGFRIPGTSAVESRRVHVIDGDTVSITNPVRKLDPNAPAIPNVRVRIEGYDTPEITQRYGQEAKIFLSALIRSAGGILITERGIDQYGRVLATARLGTDGKGGSIAAAMVRNGLAHPDHPLWIMNYLATLSPRIRGAGMWQGNLFFRLLGIGVVHPRIHRKVKRLTGGNTLMLGSNLNERNSKAARGSGYTTHRQRTPRNPFDRISRFYRDSMRTADKIAGVRRW